jgi:hypothetical protein
MSWDDDSETANFFCCRGRKMASHERQDTEKSEVAQQKKSRYQNRHLEKLHHAHHSHPAAIRT